MPDFFQEWVAEARRVQKQRQQAGADEIAFEFDSSAPKPGEDEDAWGQWYDYVGWVAEGSPEN